MKRCDQGRSQDFKKGEARIPNLYNMIVVLNLTIVGSGACFPACLLFKYVIYSVFDI